MDYVCYKILTIINCGFNTEIAAPKIGFESMKGPTSQRYISHAKSIDLLLTLECYEKV